MPERVAVFRAAQVRAAEQPLIAAGEDLMARAAKALAGVLQHIIDEVVGAAEAEPPRVLVLAGSGDNGGDALFAAAALERAAIDVLQTGSRIHTEAFAAALEAGAHQVDLPDLGSRDYEIVVDGILGIGTGADPGLRGVAREAVARLLPAVHAGRTRVVAVDLPSGLQPDEGSTADDVVLPADVTATFGAVKVGLVRGRGPELAGRLVLVDIGLGPALSAATPAATASVSKVILAPAP